MPTSPAIGIDLGTTYSTVAVVEREHVTIIANEAGKKITPSTVAFTRQGRLVGEAAENQKRLNPENTIYGIKRIIGKSFKEVEEDGILKTWPFKVINVDEKPMIEVKVDDKISRFHVEEISSMVLEKMKKIAEDHIGYKVEDAVITVPAAYDHNQRQATKDAARIAGLNVLRIINEPTAAAVAYGIECNKHVGQTILVFDMGGGTFDVTILRVEAEENLRIINSSGNMHLGGEDFDMILVSHCAAEFKSQYNIDIMQNPRALSRLKTECNFAKHSLSSASEVSFTIDSIMDGEHLEAKITRTLFNQLCDSSFQVAMDLVDTLIRESHLDRSSIDDVVLVGGSTYIAKIEELLRGRFPQIPTLRTIHPEEAVSYGAAVMAAKLQGSKDDQINELIVMDIASLSMGINVNNDTFHKIIKRNTNIPTKKTKTFKTNFDNQTIINVAIFEGERVRSSENNFLGEFDLVGIPANRRGLETIDVTFELDENGILSVEACHPTTKLMNRIKISNYKCRLSDEIVQEIIRKAEEFRIQDAKEEERMKEVMRLENFAYDNRDKLSKAFVETIDWIGENPKANVEEFRSRLIELKRRCISS